MNLNDLQTFSVVASAGSISAAAARLGVPKSTVSRRVRRLEDQLRVELLRRSPRSVSLTDAGRALHERSAASLQELHAAASALTDAAAEPAGTLRVTTVPGFGNSRGFLACITAYGLRYPKVTVSLELTTRLVDLVEEGLDVGLRLHNGPLPGSPTLMARRLLRFGRALYASPEYLAEQGTPGSPEDLLGHRIAAHAIVDVRPQRWRRDGQPEGQARILPPPRWLLNDSAALERLALSGAGLAILPTLDGERLAAEGALTRVLPDHEQEGATVSLVWPAARYLAPRVRAFIDHTVGSLSEGAPGP